MPQPYNLTNITNSDNVLSLFTATNQMTDNYFGVVILLVLWLIIFFRLKMYISESAAVSASFITALVGVFLFVMGMVSQTVLMCAIVMLAVTLILRYLS